MPGTADTVIWAPDDEWSYHSKHVEQFTDINILYMVASCWTIIDIPYICCHSTVDMHTVKCFWTDFAMWRLCLDSKELLFVGRFNVRAKRFGCFEKQNVCVWWGQIFGFISETTQQILTLLKPCVIISTSRFNIKKKKTCLLLTVHFVCLYRS
jgi:hypothetical protein